MPKKKGKKKRASAGVKKQIKFNKKLRKYKYGTTAAAMLEDRRKKRRK